MTRALILLRQHATLLLARREHSFYELTKKLSVKGYESQQIETVLAELETEGLLSNTRFAECYIRSRANKGYGPHRIRMELLERRVDEEVINNFLFHGWDWSEQAVNVFQKRYGAESSADLKARAKQQRFLQYRGFSSEQINAAMRQND